MFEIFLYIATKFFLNHFLYHLFICKIANYRINP